MIRGTTAPFKIKLPYAIGELGWVTMKWWQDGNYGTHEAPLPITKKLSHCSVSNIYICELSSDIVIDEQYYFFIEDVMYGFIAPQDLGAGNTLKYNATTKTLTVGTFTVTPTVVEITEGATGLTFVNEVNKSKELYVSLTAEETMRFSDKHKAKMQLRAQLLSNGRIFGCKPRLITVYPINDDLLDDDIATENVADGWIILDGEIVTGGN